MFLKEQEKTNVMFTRRQRSARREAVLAPTLSKVGKTFRCRLKVVHSKAVSSGTLSFIFSAFLCCRFFWQVLFSYVASFLCIFTDESFKLYVFKSKKRKKVMFTRRQRSARREAVLAPTLSKVGKTFHCRLKVVDRKAVSSGSLSFVSTVFFVFSFFEETFLFKFLTFLDMKHHV